MQRYSQTVFESLVAITGYEDDTLSDYVRVENDGVYPADCLHILPAKWRWKPRHALTGQPGITSSGPSLPFDFTATDLACFLLTHSAAFLTEVWGDMETGPQGLQEPSEYGDAADAAIVLKQAYARLQGAIAAIGPPPSEQLEAAHLASEAFATARDAALECHNVMEPGLPKETYRARHASATAEVIALKEHKQHLEVLADEHLKQWRMAITRYLCKADLTTSEHMTIPSTPAQWTLKKDVRTRDFSYQPALRLAMQAVIDQGVKPTASAVLAYWRSQKPAQILEVKEQSFTFSAANSITKNVTRKELQNAIDRQLVEVANL